MTWLHPIASGGRPLDAAVAAHLSRRWPQLSQPLLRLFAAASRAVGDGHSALDVGAVATSVDGSVEQTPNALLDALADCQAVAVGDDGAARPFVLDHGLLYLRRSHRDEVQLADGLRALAGSVPMPWPEAEIRQHLAGLFPHLDDPAGDRQAQACLLSLRARLCVILGGPGTGKTTTVARLLALHQRLAVRPLRIAVAAPTGKAAARVGEAMRLACAGLDLEAVSQVRAQTLHRLLGSDHGGTRFQYGAERPLPYDLVVLDEASMVDQALFARLAAAIGQDSRLVVLGDPDQLEAVESGTVLSELAALRPASGAGGQGVASCVIALERGYRFTRDSGIGRLASAVIAGDIAAVLDLLARPTADLRHRPHGLSGHGAALRDRGRRLYSGLSARTEPTALLRAHAGARVLCATRAETAEANRRLAESLGLGPAFAPQPGLPFLVDRNDPLRGLHNGDTGVFAVGDDGAVRAWLDDGTALRHLAVHEIGPWQPALAMTVHRAQGSEYDQVLLLLPGADLPVLSRQWLYTAITRARAGVELWGSPDVVAQAVQRRAFRLSGLARRLS